MTINVILPPDEHGYRIDNSDLRLTPGMRLGTITVYDQFAVRIKGNRLIVVDPDGVSINETGTVL